MAQNFQFPSGVLRVSHRGWLNIMLDCKNPLLRNRRSSLLYRDVILAQSSPSLVRYPNTTSFRRESPSYTTLPDTRQGVYSKIGENMETIQPGRETIKPWNARRKRRIEEDKR